jgi:hypothetical protein
MLRTFKIVLKRIEMNTADFSKIRHDFHVVYHEHRHHNNPLKLSCDTDLHFGPDSDLELRNNHHIGRRDYNYDHGRSNIDPGGNDSNGNPCYDSSRQHFAAANSHSDRDTASFNGDISFAGVDDFAHDYTRSQYFDSDDDNSRFHHYTNSFASDADPDGDTACLNNNYNFAGVNNLIHYNRGPKHIGFDQYTSTTDADPNGDSAGLYDRFHRSLHSSWKHPHSDYHFGRLDSNFDQRDPADDHGSRPNKYGHRRRYHCNFDDDGRRIDNFVDNHFCADFYSCRTHRHLHERETRCHIYHHQRGLCDNYHEHLARRNYHIFRPRADGSPDLHQSSSWSHRNDDDSAGLDRVLHDPRKNSNDHRNDPPRRIHIVHRADHHRASSDVNNRTHAAARNNYTDQGWRDS